jgi:hypothetical protein
MCERIGALRARLQTVNSEQGSYRNCSRAAACRDRLTFKAEVHAQPEGLVEAIAASVRDVTKVRADVMLSAPRSLPNDGKGIEDARSYPQLPVALPAAAPGSSRGRRPVNRAGSPPRSVMVEGVRPSISGRRSPQDPA